MDIHRNPWNSMDIQEYSSISKNPGYYRISGNPDFPDVHGNPCMPELPYMDIQHGTPRNVGCDINISQMPLY